MTASTFDTRQAQMFPALEAEQVQRLRRFGRPLTFAGRGRADPGG
jgi:hypothetical protein